MNDETPEVQADEQEATTRAPNHNEFLISLAALASTYGYELDEATRLCDGYDRNYLGVKFYMPSHVPVDPPAITVRFDGGKLDAFHIYAPKVSK